MKKRVLITVRGDVQGVGFRAYTRQEARRLGLRGYVRNLPSGEVEIVAEGDGEHVDRLVAWAHRGPPAARVEALTVAPAKLADDFTGFCITF
jgi:acylphosphatase